MRGRPKPGGDLGRSSRADGWDIAYLGDRRYVGWEGGVPVVIDGRVVGSIAISEISGDEDAELAEMAAKKIVENAETGQPGRVG